MDITEMFSDSYINYPFSNTSRMLVLGVLFCTCVFLVIPAILAGGYLLRIIENTFNGNYELPPFENWKKMFIDGLKMAAVILVYALPGLITELVLITLKYYYSMPIISTLGISLLIFMISIYISAYFLSITAIPRMIYNGRLKTAFEVKNVIKDIKIIGMKKYFLSLVGLSIIALYFMLIAGYLHELSSNILLNIGLYSIITVIITNSIINFMIYPLIIASQGRLMGLIYLERHRISQIK